MQRRSPSVWFYFSSSFFSFSFLLQKHDFFLEMGPCFFSRCFTPPFREASRQQPRQNSGQDAFHPYSIGTIAASKPASLRRAMAVALPRDHLTISTARASVTLMSMVSPAFS